MQLDLNIHSQVPKIMSQQSLPFHDCIVSNSSVQAKTTLLTATILDLYGTVWKQALSSNRRCESFLMDSSWLLYQTKALLRNPLSVVYWERLECNDYQLKPRKRRENFVFVDRFSLSTGIVSTFQPFDTTLKSFLRESKGQGNVLFQWLSSQRQRYQHVCWRTAVTSFLWDKSSRTPPSVLPSMRL